MPQYFEVSSSGHSILSLSDSVQADEAQHGHLNDGHAPYTDSLDDAHARHDSSTSSDHEQLPSPLTGESSNAFEIPQPSPSHHTPNPSDPDEYASRFTQPDGSAESNNRLVESGKTLQRVELVNGNLVLEPSIPTKLLAKSDIKTGREYTKIRYSAATCDPNDFKASGFTLRQDDEQYYTPRGRRHTELFIVITMYNEDEQLFCGTMAAIVKNIEHLCTLEEWGKDGWKRVVVCIVADGRLKIHERTLSAMAAIGAYQTGVAKVSRSCHSHTRRRSPFIQNMVQEKLVTAHIYESTIQTYCKRNQSHICSLERMKFTALRSPLYTGGKAVGRANA